MATISGTLDEAVAADVDMAVAGEDNRAEATNTRVAVTIRKRLSATIVVALVIGLTNALRQRREETRLF